MISFVLAGCFLVSYAAGQQPGILADKPRPQQIALGFKPVVERHAVILFDFRHSAILPSIRSYDSSEWRPCIIPEELAERLRDRATQAVHRIQENCQLTPEQSQKLALAAELEQRNILRRITTLVSEYDGAAFQPENFTPLYEQMRKLQAQVLETPANRDSLFGNLLDQILTPEQHARLAQSHIDWLSKAVAKSAVLSESERLRFLEHLNDAAVNVPSDKNRKEFLIQVVANLDKQRLEKAFDQRSRLAILRFCTFIQAH